MYEFPAPTLVRINNYAMLYTGDYQALWVAPRDPITALPARYRALIDSLYRGDGEAERAWADLQRIGMERMQRIPENAVSQDLAWLLGLRATGGHHYREVKLWQKKTQLNSTT